MNAFKLLNKSNQIKTIALAFLVNISKTVKAHSMKKSLLMSKSESESAFQLNKT